MKVIKLIVTGMALFLATMVQAQVSVHVSLPSPPPWGPAGYSEARYYYLPGVEAYYDVPSAMFIYYNKGAWIHRSHLPDSYRNYDLYGGYKVVMTDYRGDAPYTHFKEHKMKYGRSYRGGPQRTIGERPGNGNHDGQQGHDNDRGNKGNSHGNDKGNSQGHGKNGKDDHGQGGEKGHKK